MAISLSAPALATQMLFSGFFLEKALEFNLILLILYCINYFCMIFFVYRINKPWFVNYFRYISIFNYSFDLLMINQWKDINDIKCEYDLQLVMNLIFHIILILCIK